MSSTNEYGWNTLEPVEEWPKATCGECAWRGPEWQPRQPDGIVLAECRRNSWGGEDATGLGVVLLDWPACPAFVRRTEESS